MNFFNDLGRCIPSSEARVFGDHPSQYYVIDKIIINPPSILSRAKSFGLVHADFNLNEFSEKVESLRQIIHLDENYKSILNGTCVPFVYQTLQPIHDLGHHLEVVLLSGLRRSFAERFPESHFKAVLQGNTALDGQIELANDCGYEAFIESSKNKPVVGLYFPQALQEYDIKSQRHQLRLLPQLNGAQRCLSGGMDICAALIAQPELLISKNNYSPILCLSAYTHRDPRLALVIKSYGPHLEFWCMTQMLTQTVTQVSEQWAGGITIFDS